MSIPPIPKEFNQAKANWQAAKSEYNNALGQLKELNAQLYNGSITLEDFSVKQQALFEEYKEANNKKNELHKIASEIQSEAKFLQFKSFQFFLGEIGWAVGLLLYALVNLLHAFYVRNRYFKKEFTGKILVHSTLLFVGCFYTFYVFYSKDDFSRPVYFMAMLLCTIVLVLAGKLIVDTYSRMTHYLRENINNLVAFIFRIRNKHYQKLAVKARYAEQENVILDHNETVLDNLNEFDEDFYETIHKVRV